MIYFLIKYKALFNFDLIIFYYLINCLKLNTKLISKSKFKLNLLKTIKCKVKLKISAWK